MADKYLLAALTQPRPVLLQALLNRSIIAQLGSAKPLRISCAGLLLISFKTSNHFPPIPGSNETRPVIFPPARAMLHEARTDRIIGIYKNNWDGARGLLQGR